ncbi:MAG TPA: pyrrolysine--tRNA(Pyl) ligase large subunit [Desulfobacterales bacterium]|nr:pyrrolysine--tRNA(Pyl) ligase large subunit [Desulfobacterales bacterium]
MDIGWTGVQERRLKELEAPADELDRRFSSLQDREWSFQSLDKKLVKQHRRRLTEFRETHLRPGLCRLETRLVEVLGKKGFVQVATPIIMSKGHLSKMTIKKGHPLFDQIYWLDHNKCLRPMLAPHLYFVLKDFLRIWDKPIRIFEIGPCFRKESQGARHSNEFTMLNLVEMGLPAEERNERIAELAAVVADTAEVGEYRLKAERSAVYGNTIDIVANEGDVELGSAAMGPHPLDRAWKITDNWVGIGFGIERLLMVAKKSHNLHKMGRSLSYLDGHRLNI